jgi:uncharacterized protein YndB with AHSA1/START domain
VRSAEDWIFERRRLRKHSLDRLSEYLAGLSSRSQPDAGLHNRAARAGLTARSVQHATFDIERCYPAEPRSVFAAWADGEARQIWLDDPDYRSDGTPYELDFRVGGHERFGGIGPDGRRCRGEALIYDIVPDRRIVYGYAMYEGEACISVSLTTVEIVPRRDGTRLTYTEQGVFLDDLDTPQARAGGWQQSLDNLGTYLTVYPASGASRW